MATVLNPDEPYSAEWGDALTSLMNYKEPLGILDLLAEGAPVPEWVRVGIKMWFEGQCPSFPKDLTGENRKLAAAINAYRTEPGQTGEKRGDRHSGRIKSQGGRRRRIRQYEDDFREWERVYLGSEFYDQLNKPLKTRS
jgi:hypothetical protein